MSNPGDLRIERILARYVSFCCLLAVAFGLVSLAGWMFHIHILKSFLPGQVTVAANTSVCLILIGVSLWCLREERTAIAWPIISLGGTAAALAGVIGFLSLIEFLGNLDFGIDQLLFTETTTEALAHVRPGLMSPVAALDLVLLGLALLLLDWSTRRRSWPSQVLCFFAGIIAAFTLLDLIMDRQHFRAHIALPTVIALTMFPFALICARPKRALGGVLLAPGPKWVLFRQLIFPPPFVTGTRGGPLHYVLAVVLVAAATVIRQWSTGYLPAGLTFITYFPAVIIAALVGGLGPGILATLSAAACADYFFLPPVGSFLISTRPDLLGLLVFIAIGLTMSWLASAVDRTRQEAGEALRLREIELKEAQRIAHLGVCTVDLKSGNVAWSEEMYRMFGLDASLPPPRHPQSHLFRPESWKHLSAELDRTASTGASHELELETVHADGSQGWILVRGEAVRDDVGEISSLRAVALDITERKRAEQAIKAERQRFESVLDGLPVMICLLTPEYEVAFANQAFRKQFGESRGRKCFDYCFGRSSPCEFCQTFQVLKTNAPHDWEVITPKGHIVRAFDLPFKDIDGSPLVLEMDLDITEQRAAENKLREQAALLDLALDAIFVRDVDSRIVFWNRGASALYGWSASEATGRISHDLLKTEFPQPLEKIEAIVQHTRGWEGELVQTSRGGKRIVVAGRWSLLCDDKGSPTAILEINRDITERKRAEEALIVERQRFRDVLDKLPVYVVLLTPEYHVALDNTVFRERFGESKGRRCYEFLFNRDTPCEVCDTYNVLKDGKPHQWKWTGPDGRHYDIFDFPFTDSDGSPLILEMGMDVTERKRAESALQESESNFRALAEFVPQLVWMCTPDGLNVYFNQRWFDYTGLTPEQSFGRNWSTPFHPEDTPAAWNAWNHAVATGDTYRVESRLRAADGTYRWFLMRGLPLRDDAGAIVKWFGTCTDIDDMKQAEAEIRKLNRELEERVEQRTTQLRENEQSVRRKLDSIVSPEGELRNLELSDILDIPAVQSLLDDFYKVIPVTTGVVDIQGKVLAVPGWERICKQFHRAHPETCKNCTESDLLLSAGVAPGEFKIYKCKNSMVDVATPIMIGGEHMGNLYLGQFLFADEPIDYEAFLAQARRYGFDEKVYLAALDSVPRLSRETVNACIRFLAKLSKVISQLCYSGVKLARSSTQLGRANAELEASVKELEAFTYSVSHDLRAPLRHISGFSKMLSEEYAATLPEEAQHHLQRIEEGTRRMGLLVDDLLNLARVGRRDLDLRVTGLRSVIDEVIADLKPELQGREIEWKIGDLPFVECDPGLMKQVFQNLLSNALKFTRPRELAVIAVEQTEKDGAPVIYVRDNGVGFNMKYVERLFGVFQRLHRSEDFEGTGVGLATVQRIIQKHGGRIWAEAELDKGATFYFTIQTGESRGTKAKTAAAGERT